MKVLIACEFSGIVREAFAKRGHDAWSCDFLPSEIPGKHLQCDMRELDYSGWDMLIAFPPCTYLCSSGARWWKGKEKQQAAAIDFVLWVASLPVPCIAIENPVGKLSTMWRKPDQIIQPWRFGHGETKATCLWLKNLPCLTPTNIVEGRIARVHHESERPDRWKRRSRTLKGIAEAMAEQWDRQVVG